MPPLWGLGLWVDARFYTDAIPLGFKRVFGVYTVCVSDPVRLGMQIANVKQRQIWFPRMGKIWACTPQNRTYRAWGNTKLTPMVHFSKAHTQLLEERNTNIEHLLTNIRRDRRFESLLIRIMSCKIGLPFNIDNEIMNELVTYGVIVKGTNRMYEIANPIYQHHIQQNIKPLPSKPPARTLDTSLH